MDISPLMIIHQREAVTLQQREIPLKLNLAQTIRLQMTLTTRPIRRIRRILMI